MKRALLSASFVAAALPASAAVPSPEPMPSLRHLVFHFEYAAQAVTERRIGATEGIGAGEVTAGRTAKSSSEEVHKGDITLDVVAQTSNGGLVVDARQDSRDESEPSTRLVVDPDGQLRSLPGSELSPEEEQLLPLLGRDVIGSSVRAKGESWQIPHAAPNYKQTTKFDVVEATPPLTEVVETAGSFVLTGTHPSEGTTTGKITFNPKFAVPISASFASHERARAEQDVTVTTDSTVAFSLVSDSLQK